MSEPGPSVDSINKRDMIERKFYWKGKRVKEEVYRKRIQQTEVAKRLNTVGSGKFKSVNLKNEPTKQENLYSCNNAKSVEKVCNKDIESNLNEVQGRRIVHVKTLGKKLFCIKCNSVLSLLDVTEEKRCGLASTFYIQCRHCKTITAVDTDKKHLSSKKFARFDSNTRIAFGTLNGGLGNTRVNKVLAALNIPELHTHTYKTHEKEVGKVAEEVAKESCLMAALEERRLTIENTDKLIDLL